MDCIVQTFRAKNGKKECPPKAEANFCNAGCPGTKCDDGKCKPKKKRKKSKNPSICEITCNTGDDCCDCCKAMVEYVQEIFKLIWCMSGNCIPETRIAALLCEMLEITCNISRDIRDLVKYIFRLLCASNK